MTTPLTIRAKKRRTFGALIDSGAGVTVLSNAYAELIGIECAPEDTLDIGGRRRRVCYRHVDLHVPGTDCFVENMRVAVIATVAGDIPGAILGADFLQRTGAFLDFRRGRHAVGGDVDGRDPEPAPFIEAKPFRFAKSVRARKRNGRSRS
jgi:hypothetical protein